MPTYGASGQPASSTFNYDAVMATSLGNYRKTLTDNVSSTNLLFKTLKQKGFWEPADGGIFLGEDLLYGLGSMDSYDGYDELPLTPTEGITQAQFDWAQLAAPFSISGKERKMNKQRIVNLISTKLMQLDITMQEGFNKHFIQGAQADGGIGNLWQPHVSAVNGSKSINPLGYLITYNTTMPLQVGGIDQAVTPWWRNYSKASTATTYGSFLAEMGHLRNEVGKGVGGANDVILMDQLSYELLNVAYYQKYLSPATEVGDYPYPVLKFQGVLVSWVEFMPDVESNNLGTTWGTAYFLNSKFMRIRPESETDFVQTEMQTPINQDAKYKHVLWMGNATVNNRKKLGVLGKIPRTLAP